MASVNDIQVFIDWHHKRCVQALQTIALLADTGSDEHKSAFADYYKAYDKPTGWRVAEKMREIANDAISSDGHCENCGDSEYAACPCGDEPAWVSRFAKGNCQISDFVARDIASQVRELLVYKRAMESMAAQLIHPKMTGLELAQLQLKPTGGAK